MIHDDVDQVFARASAAQAFGSTQGYPCSLVQGRQRSVWVIVTLSLVTLSAPVYAPCSTRRESLQTERDDYPLPVQLMLEPQ